MDKKIVRLDESTFWQSAATIVHSGTLSFSGINLNPTPLTLSNRHSSEFVSISTPDFTNPTSSGSAVSSLNVYADASYLVPEQSINFTVVIKNTRNVIMNICTVTVTGGDTVSGFGQEVRGP